MKQIIIAMIIIITIILNIKHSSIYLYVNVLKLTYLYNKIVFKIDITHAIETNVTVRLNSNRITFYLLPITLFRGSKCSTIELISLSSTINWYPQISIQYILVHYELEHVHRHYHKSYTDAKNKCPTLNQV